MFAVCVRGVRFVSSLGLVWDVTPNGVLPVRSLGAPRRVDYTREFRSCRPDTTPDRRAHVRHAAACVMGGADDEEMPCMF